MSNPENKPAPERKPDLQKANSYIFTGVGAVLGGVAGVAIAGAATAVVGAALGGVLGYNLLKRWP